MKVKCTTIIYILLLPVIMMACRGRGVDNDAATGEEDGIEISDDDISPYADDDDISYYTDDDDLSSYADDEDMEEGADDLYDPNVCMSEDGIVTIESAMYPGSGTAPDYWSRWKFKNKAGKACEVFMAESPAVTNVHSITKDDGSTYYIINCFARASSSDGYEWLEAYRIIGDTIREVGVIDGGPNIANEDFDINYCIPNWYFATNGAGYDWIFEYNPETRNLYVPIIIGEISYELVPSDRFRLWHFNGKRFVDMGEKPHKDLHPSLAEYNQLIKYFETKDYIIRVDSLDSHELRYASWKKPKTIKDKPDVVIKGGFRKTYHVAYDQLRPCDDYRFTNNGYEYIVNYCESRRKEDGWGEHHDFLVIRKNGKTLLKQEKYDE